jgi:hypothetical protein
VGVQCSADRPDVDDDDRTVADVSATSRDSTTDRAPGGDPDSLPVAGVDRASCLIALGTIVAGASLVFLARRAG